MWSKNAREFDGFTPMFAWPPSYGSTDNISCGKLENSGDSIQRGRSVLEEEVESAGLQLKVSS